MFMVLAALALYKIIKVYSMDGKLIFLNYYLFLLLLVEFLRHILRSVFVYVLGNYNGYFFKNISAI